MCVDTETIQWARFKNKAKDRMRFEEAKLGWSGTVLIDKNKNVQCKEYQGFPMSYTYCTNEAGVIKRYSSCPLGV